MMLPISIRSGLLDTAEEYEGILLDAYGVFWSGNSVGLIPGSLQTMHTLILMGKTVGILSNSTQLSSREKAKLEKHGLYEGRHYHFFITSGDVARSIFLSENLPFKTHKKTFCLFTDAHPRYSSHQDIFKDTPYQETKDSDIDFVYISVPHLNGEDQIHPEVFLDRVEAFKELSLPMVCANPDLFAHEGNPPRLVVRQGSIAKMYEQIDGDVFYIGKPHLTVYSAAMKQFHQRGIDSCERILMVGDTPETDIRGAHLAHMHSALVIDTGVMSERVSHNGFKMAVAQLSQTDIPNYFIRTLSYE